MLFRLRMYVYHIYLTHVLRSVNEKKKGSLGTYYFAKSRLINIMINRKSEKITDDTTFVVNNIIYTREHLGVMH